MLTKITAIYCSLTTNTIKRTTGYFGKGLTHGEKLLIAIHGTPKGFAFVGFKEHTR